MKSYVSKCCGAKIIYKQDSPYYGMTWTSYCSKCDKPCEVVAKEEEND